MGVFDWDLARGKAVWTPQLEKIFGLSSGMLQGTHETWTNLVLPEDLSRLKTVLREWLRSDRKEEHCEYRILRPDGQVRWIAARARVVRDAEGRPLRMIGTSRDVTDRKQAEEALINQQQQLEQVVEERTGQLQEMIGELEHLSYTLAHDMRAPLRSMHGFASLLQRECETCTQPRPREFYERIINSADRLDRLIVDALSYTKVVRQKLPLHPVNLQKLLPDLIHSYPNLQPSQADIRIEGILPVVLGNEALLTQCFSNLLGNAVKFVAPGTFPKVHVWAEIQEGLARIWVEDNGIGIPKEGQSRIFTLFQRLHAEYEGTGLGLAIVRKAAERMEGKVGVESAPGQGSRFWVELKRVEENGEDT